jgi:hypothetical protein
MGPQGPTGSVSASNIVSDSTPAVDRSMNQGDTLTSTATCSAGKAMLGGGYQFATSGVATGDLTKVTVKHSYPSASNTWSAQMIVNAGLGGTITLTAYAVCVQ